ncbi:MAG: hypothetical protein ACK5LS_06640 [Propioniciclava sp.]
MNTHDTDDFRQNYLSTWTDPDPEQRRRLIENVWAPDGTLVVSSPGITLRGTAAIAATSPVFTTT